MPRNNTKKTTQTKTSRAKVSPKKSSKPARPAADNSMKTAAVRSSAGQGNHSQPNAQPPLAQVIPFRQPGWDRLNPWLANQQIQHASNGYGRVAHRFNHGRGK